MTKKVQQEINLISLIERFGSDEQCRALLEEMRWPDGIACPRCESKNITAISPRKQHHCNQCRYQFSATSGTIFHDTHLPLWKWFLTIYKMLESKKGVSALQIKRELGIAYQTAWHLCHRIRAAMKDAYPMPLKGRVEVDETWIGGKVKGKGKGYKGNKTLVVGAVQRGGKIILKVVKGRTKEDLHGFVKDTVHDDAEAIYTDEFPSYRDLEDHNTRHETVNHSEGEYVRGDVHTNSIENIWGLFKRSIVGTFHHMSVKHLDAYLDELEWRFNNRENPYLFRDTVRKLIEAERVEFSKLTA